MTLQVSETVLLGFVRFATRVAKYITLIQYDSGLWGAERPDCPMLFGLMSIRTHFAHSLEAREKSAEDRVAGLQRIATVREP